MPDTLCSLHFLNTSIAQVADILWRLKLTGLVLSERGHWTCALLPASQDGNEARFDELVNAHKEGVLRMPNAFDEATVFGRGEGRLFLEKDELGKWIAQGLLASADIPNPAAVKMEQMDWPALLCLPLGHDFQAVAEAEDRVWTPAPIAVNLPYNGLEEAPVKMARPQSAYALFALLVSTGSVALVDAEQQNALGTEFNAKWGKGDSAEKLMDWLVKHPNVDEVYLSDDAWDKAMSVLPAA